MSAELPKAIDVSQENLEQPTIEIALIEKQVQNKEFFRPKRSYIPVELEKREQLIKAVEKDGLTIKEAALSLKINYSTAKHIVKMFKKTGDVQTQMMSKRRAEDEISSLESNYLKDQTNLSTEENCTRNDLLTQYEVQQQNVPQYKRFKSGIVPQFAPNQLPSNYFVQQAPFHPQPFSMNNIIKPHFQNVHKPVPMFRVPTHNNMMGQNFYIPNQPQLNHPQFGSQNMVDFQGRPIFWSGYNNQQAAFNNNVLPMGRNTVINVPTQQFTTQ